MDLLPKPIIDTNRLLSLGIYELRNLARTLGIAHPTTLLRKDLIKQITVFIDNKVDVGVPQKTRGRKPLGTFDFSRLLEYDTQGFHELVLDTLEPDNYSVRSHTDATDKSIYKSGYIHNVTRGHGVLVTDDETFRVPMKIIAAYKLETGDLVGAKLTLDTAQDTYAVEDIIKINNINAAEFIGKPTERYDSADSVRPHTPLCKTLEFKRGQRCLIQTPKVFDRVGSIAKYQKGMEGVHKIALLLEESDDCVPFLTEQGIDRVFLGRVDYSLKKQIMVVLTALFTAKQYACEGKNVVLFLDSINKPFKIYNTGVFENGQMTLPQINLGHLMDLKTFFMSAKQLKSGGSLTVVAYINKVDNSKLDSFVHNEFLDLANCFIDEE